MLGYRKGLKCRDGWKLLEYFKKKRSGNLAREFAVEMGHRKAECVREIYSNEQRKPANLNAEAREEMAEQPDERSKRAG